MGDQQGVLDLTPPGLIRVLRWFPGSTDHSVEVLAWLEGGDLVVKETAHFAHPDRGIHRYRLRELTEVELHPAEEQQVLTLRGEHESVRLAGSTEAMSGFMHELSGVVTRLSITPPEEHGRGWLGRLAERLHLA